MSDAATTSESTGELERLPRLIERAATALAKATTAAEILDAENEATVAYDAAKLAARLAKAKDAHATVIAACHKVQADAIDIIAQAKVRLADEYDAAQKRGEVAGRGGSGSNQFANIPKENISSTVTDIGLTSKQIHEARLFRDAEKKSPGVVRRTLDEQLKAGNEPTRADIKRAIEKLLKAKADASRVRTAVPVADTPAADESKVEADIETRPAFARLAEIDASLAWLYLDGLNDLPDATWKPIGKAILCMQDAMENLRKLVESAYDDEQS
jgi:hypothetical protein